MDDTALSTYDGRTHTGYVVRKGRRFEVFDAAENHLGSFEDMREATRAISHSHRAKIASA